MDRPQCAPRTPHGNRRREESDGSDPEEFIQELLRHPPAPKSWPLRGIQKTNYGDPTAKSELEDLRLGFRLHRQRTAQPKLACPAGQPQFSGIRGFLG
jgi:hypothetical protein